MGSARKSYYQALKQIAKAANSSLTLRKTFNAIAKNIILATQGDGCRIAILNSQKKYLITIGAHGLSDRYLKKGPLHAFERSPAALSEEVIFVPDASKDDRIQHPLIAQEQRITSILGIPILKEEKLIGEIRIYTLKFHQFSGKDREFLLTIANMSATILEREELLQTFREKKTLKKKQPEATPGQLTYITSLKPTEFAHPSEEEFARLLDFFRIEWLYEPQSFPLKQEGERVIEMFTPDFYLPDLNLYIELTTLKQNLMTEKHRKLRQLKKLYPEINIKLINKNDYIMLLSKYGFASPDETSLQSVSRMLFSHSQIQRRVNSLARQISRDYAGQQLVLVGILKGVICFISDLMQHLSLPVTLEFMSISYFKGDEDTVEVTKALDDSIAGKNVLMVEDIIDTGMTLHYVLGQLAAQKPASLRVCTLLDKRVRRLANVPLDYIGFEIPDEFVIGYGLDHKGEYRNLPFIGVLKHQNTL